MLYAHQCPTAHTRQHRLTAVILVPAILRSRLRRRRSPERNHQCRRGNRANSRREEPDLRVGGYGYRSGRRPCFLPCMEGVCPERAFLTLPARGRNRPEALLAHAETTLPAKTPRMHLTKKMRPDQWRLSSRRSEKLTFQNFRHTPDCAFRAERCRKQSRNPCIRLFCK